jgi:DNA repair protein SbcD/Mre11
MPSLTFIHTADLHLDTPFKGLTSYNPELATRLNEATFRAFERIIDACIREKVDFLVISGDTFDRENQSLGAQLMFLKQVNRLANNEIPVYMICGNHDPLSSWLKQLVLPTNVYRFSSDQPLSVRFFRDKEPIADILGISYHDKALTENIAVRYHRPIDPAPFSIALLHGNLSGSTQHDNYAPFSLVDLLAKNIDYWALGHIHQQQILHPGNPVIAYSGNPQGRDFGEKGPKGCLLVTLSTEHKPLIEPIPTHWVRFDEITVDLSDVALTTDLLDKIRRSIENALNDEVSSSVMRLKLTGRTSLHHSLQQPNAVGDLIAQLNEGQLLKESFRMVDAVRIYTSPEIDLEQRKQGNDYLAAILQAFDRLEADASLLDQSILELGKGMSPHLRSDNRQLSEEDRQYILRQARLQLADLLTKEEA